MPVAKKVGEENESVLARARAAGQEKPQRTKAVRRPRGVLKGGG